MQNITVSGFCSRFLCAIVVYKVINMCFINLYTIATAAETTIKYNNSITIIITIVKMNLELVKFRAVILTPVGLLTLDVVSRSVAFLQHAIYIDV